MATTPTKPKTAKEEEKKAPGAVPGAVPEQPRLSREAILVMQKEDLSSFKERIEKASPKEREALKEEIVKSSVDERLSQFSGDVEKMRPLKTEAFLEKERKAAEKEAQKFADEFIEGIYSEKDIDAFMIAFKGEQEKRLRKEAQSERRRKYRRNLLTAATALLGGGAMGLGIKELLSDDEKFRLGEADGDEEEMKCPNCGVSVKSGWFLCPACKSPLN